MELVPPRGKVIDAAFLLEERYQAHDGDEDAWTADDVMRFHQLRTKLSLRMTKLAATADSILVRGTRLRLRRDEKRRLREEASETMYLLAELLALCDLLDAPPPD